VATRSRWIARLAVWRSRRRPAPVGPDAARQRWVRRCARRLAELRPDVESRFAEVAAGQLWENANDLDPHHAAAIRSVTWSA
jgi:hypothetical protein